MIDLQPVGAAVLVGGAAATLWLACALRTASLRRGLLVAAVLLGVVVWAATEALSVVHDIGPVPLVVVYLALAAGSGQQAWRHRQGLPGLQRNLRAAGWWPLAALALVVLLPLLVDGLVAAPNNWDSMTYHLARVEHWRVDGSVAFYPTAIDRQLWMSPLAEFGVLHLRVLSGGDRFAALVQLAALPAAAVAASVVAQTLGLSRRAQFATAVVVLTTPMAVVQATTTQNDLLCAAFVATAVAGLIALPRGRRRPDLLVTAGVGAAMGLALLTKPTALVFLLPFALVWCVRGRRLLGASAVQAAVMVTVLLVLNAPHLTRTQELFGTPLGQGEQITGNQRYGVDVTLENLVRNLALNVATPVGRVNDAVTTGIVRGMEGVGLQVDDPADTFAGQPFAVSFDVQEDVTANLAQLGLLALAAGALAVSRELRRRLGTFCGCLAVGMLAFCSLFAWQPWGNRLLLPLFVLGAVPAGALMARLPRRVLVAALALLVVAALPWALSSRYRPLVPFVPSVTNPSVLGISREHGYFLTRPELEDGYRRATDKVVALGAHDVGLVQGLDSWEYPLWALLRGAGSAAVLRDVHVDNDSASLEDSRRPDALLCTVACTIPPRWHRADYGSVTVSWPPGHRR